MFFQKFLLFISDISELQSKFLTLLSNLIAKEIYRKNLQPNIIYKDYYDYSQKNIYRDHVINIFWAYIYSNLREHFNFSFFFSARNSAVFVTCNKHWLMIYLTALLNLTRFPVVTFYQIRKPINVLRFSFLNLNMNQKYIWVTKAFLSMHFQN